MRQALVEFVSSKPILTEAENGDTLLEGVAGQVGVKNRNGRIYPVEVMRRAVDAVQEDVSEGAFTGELDHPDWNPSGSLEKTAMRFTSFWMEGDLMKFKAAVLETQAGQTLKALLRGGVKVGMSTRGIGNVRYEEVDGEEVAVVDVDYELFGVDAVKMPSSEAGVIKLRESLEESLSREKGLSVKTIQTVEDLREAHSDLVTKIEESVRTAVLAEAAAEKAELEESVSTLTTERDELQGKLTEATADVERLGEVKRTLLGESTEGNAKGGSDAVVVKLDAIMERLENAETENQRLRDEASAKEARAALETQLTATFESAVAGHPSEKILRKRIKPLAFESVESLESKVEDYKELLEETGVTKLKKDQGESGKGVINEDEDDNEEKVELTEEERRQFQLAGLQG